MSLRTRAIPGRLRGVFTQIHVYLYLYLPRLQHRYNFFWQETVEYNLLFNVQRRNTTITTTTTTTTTTIGVDLARIPGVRMASAEGGSVPSGVGYEEGCPLSSRLGGLLECRELPQRGPGRNPDRKRILAYFKSHKTLLL